MWPCGFRRNISQIVKEHRTADAAYHHIYIENHRNSASCDPGTASFADKFRVVCTDHLQSQGRTQGWSDSGTSSCRLDVSAAFSALQASYQSGAYAAITGADLWDTRVETAGAKEREAEEG